MRLRRLWLTDFRNYASVELEPADGLTAVVGANGEGKTNLLEAVGYLATLASFRGAPPEALVRGGSPTAVVRAEVERAQRQLLIEAEISAQGRSRVQLNRQRLGRSRDLLGALRVSVFSPDDLSLVKGGPAERRRYLDETLVSVQPRHDALRTELERVLRQRNALLRQVAAGGGGRSGALGADTQTTLDVWDAKLVALGDQLGARRAELVGRLEPLLAKAYDQVAGAPGDVAVTYAAPWMQEGLAAALATVRRDELRRGVSLVGPHRDDLDIVLGGMPARTHASQGEQRSLALALRLGAHLLVTEAVEQPPVLLLDDVFSELDPQRSDALLAHLPGGQTLLSTAGGLPPGALPDLVVHIHDGRIS